VRRLAEVATIHAESFRQAVDGRSHIGRTAGLQGMWTNYDPTPFERLTPEEVAPRGPAVSTQWKVAFPLNRDEPYRIFEYACHEGNHALKNRLRLGAKR
jgi:hypothetical protein